MTPKISFTYFEKTIDATLYCHLNDTYIFSSRKAFLGEDFEIITRFRVDALINTICALKKPNKKGEYYTYSFAIDHVPWYSTQPKLESSIIEFLERLKQ